MNLDLGFYWRLLLRRLPILMAIVILCSLLGVAVAMRAEPVFRTEARLLVEDPQIPGDLASSTVRTNANATIEIIRQRLLTRANLLDIADDLEVFETYSSMSPDDIVQRMQAATDIRSQGGGRSGQPIIVTVGFVARSGQVAADVVNEYVTRIVNANVELRTSTAEETLTFFEQEAQRLSTELDLQSGQITLFQAENSDALPNDQQFRLSRLALLQERLGNAERERAALVGQRARVVEIFEATGEFSATGSAPLSPEQRQLQQLESDLNAALLVFSEANPQVQLLRRRIEQLRNEISTNGSPDVGEGAGGASAQGTSVLEVQLAQIDSQIESLDIVIAEADEEITTLEDAIARTPANAIVLRSLERDYENVRRQYDRVIASLAEASTGERIEVSARGQRISVVEAANVPRQPSTPKQFRTILVGVAAGIGLAGGLFILLELLNRSVRRPAEITSALGIQTFASIPFLEDPRRRMIRRTTWIASFVLIVVGVPAVLWALDTYYLPLDQLADRILRGVGFS